MAKNKKPKNKEPKNKEPKNIWEYADWLLNSHRLTIEEHEKLQVFIFQFEDEARGISESL